MQRSIIAFAFALTACGGTATQNDEVRKPDPNPPTSGFVEVPEKDLTTTPYMTQWQLNEVYADTTDSAGVIGRFTFAPLQRTELKIGFEEVHVTECTEPGGANPSYVLVRADGTRLGIDMEEDFVVEPQESVKLEVSFPNLAKCHAIDVTFGVNFRTL